jgi:hypothetical protein
MGVKNSELADLIATTLNDLPKQEFEVGWDNQDYEFCRIYQKERLVVDGGPNIERKVMLDTTGNARYRRLYDTDEPKVGQTMHTITVPWTQIGTDYSWDKVEIMRNKASGKGFVDLMKTRRIDGLWGLANLIEDRAWKTPESSTDDLYPYGVPYYITFFTDASGTVNSSAGFNGIATKFQDGTYTGTIAGINAVNEDKWRNYCALYTNIDAAMLKIFRKAFLLTRFKPPLFLTDPGKNFSATKRIYCGADEAVAFQELMDFRDDNHKPTELLGGVATMVDGAVFVNRVPVVYIPQLNSASYSPIYCVDFAKFIPYVQDGYWMEEGEPMTDRGQHTTFTVFLDGAHNNLCTNRRTCGFVLHKAS